MPDLLRYPQSDGSTKVIDPATGETTFENKPVTTPFGKPNVRTVELPGEPVPNGFTVPAGTVDDLVTNGDVAAAAPKPDMVSQQVREADRKTDPPPGYPAGSPELQSLLRLEFRQRSRAMKLFQAAIDAWNRMPQLGTQLDTPDKLDRYFEGLAAFDDLLAVVAVNSDAYRSWQKNVDDSTMANLFFAYVARFGLGES